MSVIWRPLAVWPRRSGIFTKAGQVRENQQGLVKQPRAAAGDTITLRPEGTKERVVSGIWRV